MTAQRNCLSLSGGQGRLPGGGHIQRETSVMNRTKPAKVRRKTGNRISGKGNSMCQDTFSPGPLPPAPKIYSLSPAFLGHFPGPRSCLFEVFEKQKELVAGVLRKHEVSLDPAQSPGFHGCLPHSHAAGETWSKRQCILGSSRS